MSEIRSPSASRAAALYAAGLGDGAGSAQRFLLSHFSIPNARPLLGFLLPLFLLLAWTASAHFGWLPEQILPAPEIVWISLRDYAQDGGLWSDSFISLQRVLRGFALGAGIGLALGAGMALSRGLKALADPVFLAVSQVPIVGWIPLLILLIGIDEGLKTLIIALASFIPVTLGTYQGIRDVPARYREVGRVFLLSPAETLRHIVLPAAAPAIFTGLREAAANAWQTLIAVELLASTEGLGYLMAYGRQLFQLELVLTAVVAIGAIGFLTDWLLGRVARYLQRWELRG
ncbi:ABC transporter permease [Dongia sp.]|uniref:ABC transporter permease n=1 Tax=Dongia sp. TaxID=1977262 RepID=UPI0035B4C244